MSQEILLNNNELLSKTNEKEENNNFIKRRCMLNLKRRCKDRLAVIVFFTLYLFLLVAPLAKIILMDKTPMEKIANFIFPRFFIRSFLIYGILLVFYIVMSIWFISELVVLSFLLGIANVIFTIYLFVKYKLHFTVIIAPSLLLLCFLGYYAFYRKTLELSLKTFRCSAAILKHYIPGMILVSVLGAVMFIPLYLMMVVISSDIQQNKFNTVLVIMLLIYITWYMSVLKSFIDCYISSLIFYRIYGAKNVGMEAFKTAVMSVGTCAIAGFIEMLFNLLRSFIKNKTSSSSWFTSGILTIFLKWLLNGAMDLIMVFMDIYHKFVIGFTSLHNTNYLDGAKLTYKNISNFKGYPLANYLTYGLILRGMEFVGITIMALTIMYDIIFNGIIQTVTKNLKGEAEDVEVLVAKVIQIPLAPISGFAIARFIYQKLFSGSMAVLLLYCVDRETLNLQFPDFSMEKEI